MELNAVENFEENLALVRARLIEHPLFFRIKTVNEMRFFMESHVFAVWDFMSLLKTLQRQLTHTTVPWMPPKNREAARLINEIVVGEESDEISPGEYISHFELYLEAMREGGACAGKIESFLAALTSEGGVARAFSVADVAPHLRSFVSCTLRFCRLEPHQVAAAFLYGREDIIPEMFTRILTIEGLAGRVQFQKLRIYLQRHIDLDGGSHGPMSRKLINNLCGSDPNKWAEAKDAALLALQARHALWDGVLAELSHSKIKGRTHEEYHHP